ncbi:FeoA family protein [Sutterella massiliensis]|nr:FeoA family protein [Sutterella massiliensis]
MMNGTKRIRTLTELGPNSPATVARMKLDQKDIDRLADLGMRLGAEVRVLQSAPEAPLLVAVLDARIAVNYDIAKRIYVY